MSDDIHLIATQSECRELLARYLLVLDLKDWDKLDSVFATNAVFKRTDMAALDGSLQIQAYFEALETKRTDAGEILPFQPGVGMLASRLRIPVVPVRLEGLEKVLHKSAKFPTPGRARVKFGQPLRLEGDDYAALAKQIEDAVGKL